MGLAPQVETEARASAPRGVSGSEPDKGVAAAHAGDDAEGLGGGVGLADFAGEQVVEAADRVACCRAHACGRDAEALQRRRIDGAAGEHDDVRAYAAGGEKAAEDVGFYYAANAAGRFAGILLSGLLYGWGGLPACLIGAAAMLGLCWAITLALPARRPG